MRHLIVVALACTACGGVSAAGPPPRTDPAATATIDDPAVDPPVEPAQAPPAAVTMPAPAAPGSDGAPIDNLEAWSAGIESAAEHSVLALDGALLIVDAAHFTRVSGDGATPTLVRDNPVGREGAFADELVSPSPIADGAFLLRGAGGALAAIDVATLEVRWVIHRLDLPHGSDEAHLSSGDAFLVVLRDSLLALDPHDGRVLWQTTQPGSDFSRSGRWRAAPGLFVALESTHLVAHDARTGVVRWQRDGFDASSDRLFDADADRVPVLRDEEVVIVSLTDGSEIARVALHAHPSWGRTVALRGDALYVLVPTHRDEAGENELRRYALGTPAPRWRSIALASDTTGDHPSLAIDDDAIFVCTTNWFGRALDREDGRVRWSGPIPTCGAPLPWRPRAGAPNVILLSAWSDQALARAASAPAERPVRVTGTLTCNGRPASRAVVWVNGEHVRTDAAGRYRAITAARTDVVVAVAQFERDPSDFCVAARRVVPVSDAVDASFELERGGGGGSGLI